MIFVEWEGKMLLKIEVEEFSYTEDMFNSSIEISIKPNEFNKNITNYINNWTDFRDQKDLVLFYKNENDVTKYYLLKSGVPKIVNIGHTGELSTCKFQFEEMKEISRPLKISEILNK